MKPRRADSAGGTEERKSKVVGTPRPIHSDGAGLGPVPGATNWDGVSRGGKSTPVGDAQTAEGPATVRPPEAKERERGGINSAVGLWSAGGEGSTRSKQRGGEDSG